MALIKRYSSRYLILELSKFSTGYQIKQLSADSKTGEFTMEWRHSRIKSLVDASKQIMEHVIEAEITRGVNFTIIYSRH